MIAQRFTIFEALSLIRVRVDASELMGLPTETLYPDPVVDFSTCDYVIVRTILDVFITQLQRPFNFDFFHTSVFRTAINIVSRNKQALMCLEVLQSVVHGRPFRLPVIRNNNDFFRRSFWENRAESLYWGWTDVNLAASSHPQRQFYQANTKMILISPQKTETMSAKKLLHNPSKNSIKHLLSHISVSIQPHHQTSTVQTPSSK